MYNKNIFQTIVFLILYNSPCHYLEGMATHWVTRNDHKRCILRTLGIGQNSRAMCTNMVVMEVHSKRLALVGCAKQATKPLAK